VNSYGEKITMKQLPTRQFLKPAHLAGPLPDITQLPITPLPDITQFPTKLIYPDIAQLTTKPKPVPPEVKSSIMQDESPNSLLAPANQINHSRFSLCLKLLLLFLCNLIIPFLLYVILDDYGFKITSVQYDSIAISMLVITFIIAVRVLLGLDIEH
jgi:hypothetical protein